MAELRRLRGSRRVRGAIALALGLACLGAVSTHGAELGVGQFWLWVVPGVSAPAESGVSSWINGYQAGVARLELTIAVVDSDGEIRGSASWTIEAGRTVEFSLDALLGRLPAGERGSVLLSGQDVGPGQLALRLFQRAAGAAEQPLPGYWLASDPAWLPSLAKHGPAGG